MSEEAEKSFDVLAIAMELHTNRWGSNDSFLCLPPGTKDVYLRILKHRLQTWRPGHARCVQFDEAVRNLLLAAVQEYEPGWAP